MGIQSSPLLVSLIDQVYNADVDIELVSISTADGFVIHQSSSKRFRDESDKIAAIASTFSSISNSIANEIIDSSFNIAFIETPRGNFVCIHTLYLGKSVVLILFAKDGMSLGTLRVKARNLGVMILKLGG